MLDIVSSRQCINLSESVKPLLCLGRPTIHALRSLNECSRVSLKAVAESQTLKRALTKSNQSGPVEISINVYGPPADASHAGTILSRASTFLQHPFFLESQQRYFNPQIYRPGLGTKMEDLTHLVGLKESDIKAKILSDEIDHVLESLDSDEVDRGPGPFEVNPALLSEVITPLLRFVPSPNARVSRMLISSKSPSHRVDFYAAEREPRLVPRGPERLADPYGHCTRRQHSHILKGRYSSRYDGPR